MKYARKPDMVSAHWESPRRFGVYREFAIPTDEIVVVRRALVQPQCNILDYQPMISHVLANNIIIRLMEGMIEWLSIAIHSRVLSIPCMRCAIRGKRTSEEVGVLPEVYKLVLDPILSSCRFRELTCEVY